MSSFPLLMLIIVAIVTVVIQRVETFAGLLNLKLDFLLSFGRPPGSFHDEVPDSDVRLLLYTRQNPLNAIDINGIDTKKPTKIIVHGWLESAEKVWCKNITREYLKKGNYNVIVVDWSQIAAENYISSALKTTTVGTILGRHIVEHGLPLTATHIIGHSLGAHVSGLAGREVTKLTGQKLFRISALDAARPLFEGSNQESLQKSDALVVDAIHTDGGVFGLRQPYGTVDFYPNGGMPIQPGCNFLLTFDIILNITRTLENVFCSHTRSYYYFISSINDEKFVASRCNSWRKYLNRDCNGFEKVFMGDDYDLEAKGRFYLKTNAHAPFAYNF